MEPVSLCSILKKKSFLPIALANLATLTLSCSTVHLEKVCPMPHITIVALISSMILVELRDDSHVIPRSSSVVVKRMPPARPGKGKAAMYIGAPGTSATPESKPNNQPGGASWSSRASMSRRFDREASKPVTVRTIRPCFLNSVPYAPDSRVDTPPKYNWQG